MFVIYIFWNHQLKNLAAVSISVQISIKITCSSHDRKEGPWPKRTMRLHQLVRCRASWRNQIAIITKKEKRAILATNGSWSYIQGGYKFIDKLQVLIHACNTHFWNHQSENLAAVSISVQISTKITCSKPWQQQNDR